MSSVIQCQTCNCDFDCGDTLSAHIKGFDSEEWLLVHELTLCRYHISSNEFDAWLSNKERALNRHQNFDVELDARRLSQERALHPTESHICQRCKQSFKTLKDLESHLGNYQLHEMHLLGKIARCRLHFRPPEISYACDHNDQCPVKGCIHKSDDHSNRKRHFEKHVECFVVCPDEKCQRSFDSASPFIHHRCTTERDVKRRVLRLKKAARQRAIQGYQFAIEAIRTETHSNKTRESAPLLSDRPAKRRLLRSSSQAPIIEELNIATDIPPPDFRPDDTESFSALNNQAPTLYDNNLNGTFFLMNESVGAITSMGDDLDGAYYLMNGLAETNAGYFTNDDTNMNNQSGMELLQAYSIIPGLVD